MLKPILTHRSACAILLGLILLCGFSGRAARAQVIGQNLIAAQDGWEFGNALASSGNTLVVGDSSWVSPYGYPVGAVYAFSVSNGQGTQTAEVTANDAQPFDAFGSSVAISGSTLVVGAAGHNGSGAVYIYTLVAGYWFLQQEIVPADGHAGDNFGCAVALSQNTLVVGACQKGVWTTGAVYTYTLNGAVWMPQAEWPDPDGANLMFTRFGSALSLSGTTLAIGAPGTYVGAGAVYLYRYTSGKWKRLTAITSGIAAGDGQFGYSVILSGALLLVGAPGLSAVYSFSSANNYTKPQSVTGPIEGSSVTGFGAAMSLSGTTLAVSAVNDDDVATYVFTQGNGGWTANAELTPWDFLQQSNTQFGAAVAVLGTTIAVARPGAWYGTFAPGSPLGEVCCFTLGGAEGTATGAQIGSSFAYATALSGTTFLVGAPGWNMNQGRVSVYTQKKSSLTQQTGFKAANGQAGDGFGWALAFDGTTLVVGAPYANNGTGAVYLYTFASGVWTFDVELTASDGQVGDGFGTSVGLSSGVIAVGAPGQNGSTGAAYVYALAGTTWSQQAELTETGGQSGDGFGTSVGVSSGTLVVGAPYADTAISPFAGTAFVYAQNGSQWTPVIQLMAFDGQFGDQYGFAVGISGTELAIGAPGSDVGSGVAYTYIADTGSWDPQAELTDPNPNTQFGAAIALSTTALSATLAVGAYSENGAAGQVYVYTLSGAGSWLLPTVLSAQDGQPYDNFGASIAISGSNLAIGAPYASGGAGSLYAY